jgi:uncharacterized membrane protein (UPF0182 family)
MRDARVFYNKEDVWNVSKEIFESGEQGVIPYFVLVSLPEDNTKNSFVLMLPLTPKDRSNMIAWVAARCDGQNYGDVLAYKFSKQQLIYGTLQVEAKINQDEQMASQFTLWSKSSSVIRGNTLVIPIGNTIVYTQPVYLKSAQAMMPQLVRVIVGSLLNVDNGIDFKLAWDKDFNSALADLLSSATVVVTEPSTTSPTTTPVDIKTQIVDELNKLKQQFNGLNDELNKLINLVESQK